MKRVLARARVALEGGLRLIQLREKDWPLVRQRDLGEALITLARPYGGARGAQRDGGERTRVWTDGVHWTSAALAAASERLPI